jgi:hypothetical protein
MLANVPSCVRRSRSRARKHLIGQGLRVRAFEGQEVYRTSTSSWEWGPTVIRVDAESREVGHGARGSSDAVTCASARTTSRAQWRVLIVDRDPQCSDARRGVVPTVHRNRSATSRQSSQSLCRDHCAHDRAAMELREPASTACAARSRHGGTTTPCSPGSRRRDGACQHGAQCVVVGDGLVGAAPASCWRSHGVSSHPWIHPLSPHSGQCQTMYPDVRSSSAMISRRQR